MTDNARMRECAQEERKPAATVFHMRMAKAESREPVAWYIDGEDGREHNGFPEVPHA